MYYYNQEQQFDNSFTEDKLVFRQLCPLVLYTTEPVASLRGSSCCFADVCVSVRIGVCVCECVAALVQDHTFL